MFFKAEKQFFSKFPPPRILDDSNTLPLCGHNILNIRIVKKGCMGRG